jgi:hypothetical protein
MSIDVGLNNPDATTVSVKPSGTFESSRRGSSGSAKVRDGKVERKERADKPRLKREDFLNIANSSRCNSSGSEVEWSQYLPRADHCYRRGWNAVNIDNDTYTKELMAKTGPGKPLTVRKVEEFARKISL